MTKIQLSKENPRTVTASFAHLVLYPDHIVVEIHDGVDFREAEANALRQVILDTYGDRPIGYLSMRTASYSVNPIAARVLCNETTLVAAAFVIDDQRRREAFEAERPFYKTPVEAFASIKLAEDYLAAKLAEYAARIEL